MLYRTILSSWLLLAGLFLHAQPGHDLARAVLKSFEEQNFDVLQPYLLDEETALKAFPKDFGGLSPEEIRGQLDKAYGKARGSWEAILGNMRTIEFDPSIAEIKEVVIYPISPGSEMKGLIAAYQYNTLLLEDFYLVVAQVEGNTYLLDFPKEIGMLSFYVAPKSEMTEIKQSLSSSIQVDDKLPGLLKERVGVLLSVVRIADPAMFGNFCVYRGNDITRQWKDRVDTDREGEMEYVISWKKRLNKILPQCSEYEFDPHLVEKESEGTWIVQPLRCADGTVIYFAFLDVRGELLLGDIDIERKD